MAEEVLNQDQLEQQVPQQEEPPKKLSVGEFASKIKSKYPEYKDIDDNELTSKMLSKFPIYKDQVDFSEKKNDGQPLKLGGQELKTSGTPPTPSQSPSNLQEGEEEPTQDYISLSKQANQLLVPAYKPQPVMMGGGMMGMGTSPSFQEEQKNKVDPEKEKQSKALKDQIKAAGYNPDKLVKDVDGINDAFLKNPLFSNQQLLSDYKKNPQLYERKIATAKWQSELYNSLKGKVNSQDYNKAIQSLNNIALPNLDYNTKRDNINDIVRIVKNSGIDKDKADNILGNLYTDLSDSYVSTPIPTNDELYGKGLNDYQIAAYHSLQDINPSQAIRYKSALLDDKSIGDSYTAQFDKENSLKRLEEAGISMKKNWVLEQINKNSEEYNNLYKSAEDGTASQVELDRLTQLESIMKPYRDEYQKANEAENTLHKKYPNVINEEAKSYAKDLIGEKGVLGETGEFIISRFEGLGKSTLGAAQTVYDILATPFLNDEKKDIEQSKVLGFESLYANRFHRTSDKNETIYEKQVLNPYLQNEVDKIKNDSTLTYEQKINKTHKLLIGEPISEWKKEMLAEPKSNLSIKSMLYGVTDMAVNLIPFFALEGVTGGGFTGAFTAGVLTGFHDNYVQALEKGSKNPYSDAAVSTAIYATAMAVGDAPAKIREAIGNTSPIGKILSKLDDKSITKILKSGNEPTALKLLKKTYNIGYNVLESTAKGIPSAAGFTASMSTGKIINDAVLNDVKSPGEYVNEYVNSTLHFIPFNAFMGIGGKILRGEMTEAPSTVLTKNALITAAAEPNLHLNIVDEKLKDGSYTPEQAGQIKNNIIKANTILQSTPMLDVKGKDLNDSDKRELLYLKMQESDAVAMLSKDIPDELKDNINKKLEKVRSKISSIYKGEYIPDEVKAAKEAAAKKAEPKAEIPEPDLSNISELIPQEDINTAQSVMDRVNNNEAINIDDIEKGRAILYNTLDSHPEAAHLIESLIQKLESHENLTKTETVQTTEREPIEGTLAAKQKIQIKPALEQSEGSTARVVLADGTTGEGTLRIVDGNYVIEAEGQEPIVVGEKAITDRDLKVPEGESPVELDENGNVKSATFETKDGHKVTITDPEKALDLGIQLSLETVGEIPDEAFDKVYQDVVKETEVEVPVEKPKKAEAEPQVPELSEEEYKNFKEKGTVSDERLNHIADKVMNKEELSDREKEIQASKKKDIDKLIEDKEKEKTRKKKVEDFKKKHGKKGGEKQDGEKSGEDILKELEDKGIKSSDEKSLNELAEKNKGNKIKRKIIEQARKAIKTLKSIFPNMDIHLHENEQDFNDVMDKIKSKKSTGGNFAYTKNADGTYSGRIDINLDKANLRTIAHEVTHAVLFKAFGENQELFQSFRDKISKVLGSATDKNLQEFADNPFYKKTGVTAEEYLSELSGLLSSKTINPLTLSKIASAINEFVSKLTGGKFIPFENVNDAKDVVEFFDKVSSAIKKGNDLTNIVKEKIAETPEQKKALIESRMQAWGAFEKLGFEETDEFKKLVESGHIVKDYDLSEIAGMPVFIINPDNMLVGSVKLGDKIIGEGKGGVHFVSDTGDVWAFSDTSRGKVNAAKMAEFLNNQLKENGVAHIILSRGDLGKLFSSHAGARGAMRVLEALVDKKIISKMDFRNALKDVSMMKDIEGAKEELEDLIKQREAAIKKNKPFDANKEDRIQKLQTNLEANANRKYDINFTGIKLETIHNDVESQFFNKSDNSFSNRGTFVTDVIEHLAKNGDFSKEQINKLRKYLNTKELPASSERKTGNITFSLDSIKDAVGLLFSDEAVVGGRNSDAYAVIKVENPKYPIEMIKGSHESYGAHVRQVVDNIPLDKFLNENSNLQKEDLIINEKNQVIGIRPKLLLLSEKNHIADVVNNQNNEPTVANKLGSNTIGLAEGIIKPKSDFPEQKIKSKSQFEEEKGLPLTDETKKYEQQPKSTENTQGREGIPKSITAGKAGAREERPRNAESYSNPDGTPQYVVKRSDRDGGKRLDISVNGTPSKAKAVYTQSEQLKSAVNNYRNAYTDKNLIELDDPKLFHKLITQSKSINEFGASVHVYEPGEYAQMRLFITPDGKAGVALKPDGDLVSGFSNQEVDKPRRIAQLLGLAIKEGAMKADSFDTVLPQYYLDFGLIPVAQDKWNEQFKPEKWDKEVFKRWNNGEPDVIYYVYKGGDRSTISERAGEFGSWKDLKKDVPYAEYDDAIEIQEQSIKSKSQLPEQVEATAKALEDLSKVNPSAIKNIGGKEYYHGTSLPKSESDFTSPNRDKGEGVRSNSFMGTTRKQKSPFFFITSEKSVATDFAKSKEDYFNSELKPKEKHTARIIPFKFDEKNSKVLDLTKDDYEGKMEDLGFNLIEDYGIGMYDESMMWEYLDDPKFAEKLKLLGYDAVKFVEPKRGTGIAVLNTEKVIHSSPKGISEAYHKGNNPKLTKSVNELLGVSELPQQKGEGVGEKMVVFRGEGKKMGEGINEGFNWVSSSKEHASEFSDNGNVVEYEMPKPKNTYKFPWSRISQPITGEQLVNAIDKAIIKAVKEKIISEAKWREINEKKKQLINSVDNKIESFQTKVNNPKSSKIISDILSDLGYDAIEVNDKGVTNYGLIKNKQAELPQQKGVGVGEAKTGIESKSQDTQNEELNDMKDIVKDLVDEGKSLDDITKQVTSDLGDNSQATKNLISKAHSELTKKPAETKVSGISHEALTQTAERLGMDLPQRGKGTTPEQQQKLGQDFIEAGVDPEEIANDFVKSGKKKVSGDELAVAQAHYANLQKVAQDAMDKYGRDSKQCEDAVAEMQIWQDEILKPMGTIFHEIGQGLQAGTDIDTGSYIAMEGAVKEKTGQDLTSEQQKKVTEISDKSKKAEKDLQDTKNKLTEHIDNAIDEENKKEDLNTKIKKIVTKVKKSALPSFLKNIKEGKFKSKPQDTGDQEQSDALANAVVKMENLLKKGVEPSQAVKQAVEELVKLNGEESRAEIEDGFREYYDNKGWEEEEETPEQKKAKSNIKRLEKELEDLKQGKEKGKPVKREITDKENQLKKQIQDEKDFLTYNKLVTSLQGKKDNNFTMEQIKGIWEYAKKEYLDKGVEDFDDMFNGVATDLGLTPDQVRRAISQPKGAKAITEEMYRNKRIRDNAVQYAKDYVASVDNPNALKFMKALPAFFFSLRTFGHGTVGFITHAGMDIFNPNTWKMYFPHFLKQFQYAYGSTAKYEAAMADLVRDKDFIKWKNAGLAIDPKTSYTEYEGLKKMFGKLGMAGDRGFNALKVYRLAKAKAEYNKLSNTEKADPKMAKYIAEYINRSTGTTDVKVPGFINTTLFAPKLIASQFERITTQPIKALATLSKGSKASPTERAAAKIVVKNCASVIATYAGALAANGAMLALAGSSQTVNYTDPSKKDWLRFKMGDKQLDVSSGIIPAMNFIGSILAYSATSKSKKKDIQDAGTAFLLGKVSPLASTIKDFLYQEDFHGDIMPFSNKQPTPGHHKLTWKEYIAKSQAPIPIAEAMTDFYKSSEDKGMKPAQINDYLNAAFMGVTSGFTGAKLKEITPGVEEKPVFTEKEMQTPVFKDLTKTGVEIPELGTRLSYTVKPDEAHPKGIMTTEEFKKFSDLVIKYSHDYTNENLSDSYTLSNIKRLKELVNKESEDPKVQAEITELKKQIKSTLQSAHQNAIDMAREELKLYTK